MSYPNSLFAFATVAFMGFAVVACEPPTSFKGEAQFPGGATGCFARCKEGGMEMATFVYVGDYSSACACRLKKKEPATGGSSEAAQSDDASTVAAAAGVELQRRRLAEQQRQQQQQQTYHYY